MPLLPYTDARYCTLSYFANIVGSSINTRTDIGPAPVECRLPHLVAYVLGQNLQHCSQNMQFLI